MCTLCPLLSFALVGLLDLCSSNDVLTNFHLPSPLRVSPLLQTLQLLFNRVREFLTRGLRVKFHSLLRKNCKRYSLLRSISATLPFTGRIYIGDTGAFYFDNISADSAILGGCEIDSLEADVQITPVSF